MQTTGVYEDDEYDIAYDEEDSAAVVKKRRTGRSTRSLSPGKARTLISLRGRPRSQYRKHDKELIAEDALDEQEEESCSGALRITGPIAGIDNRPREEHPYTDFHQDLNPEKSLLLLDADVVDGFNTKNNEVFRHIRSRSALRSRHSKTRKASESDAVSIVRERDAPEAQKLKPVFRQLQRTDHHAVELLDDDMSIPLRIFSMPESYIKADYIDTYQTAIEYDMDEQDDEFLIMLNDYRRKKYAATPISRILFELAMTLIEKEWFSLQIMLPKPKIPLKDALADNADESNCAICDDGECENSNAIVFCDGCNIAVHQDCYGVPFIPEGQWLCRLCLAGGIRREVSCVFCPNKSGAFKQTDRGQWAHLLCALWLPEISIGNTIYMEPVEGIEHVPRQRWKLLCYICKQKYGACIQCVNRSCFTAFHPTCARRAGLQLKMTSTVAASFENYDLLEAYCDRHSLDGRDIRERVTETQKFYASTLGNKDDLAVNRTSSSEHSDRETRHEKIRIKLNLSRVTNSSNDNEDSQSYVSVVYKTNEGAPIIPYIIYKRLCNRIRRYGLRKRKEFIAQMCRYWTLKKEFRRGAALLKRLQVTLETRPDKDFTSEQEKSKLAFADMLHSDLDHLVEITSTLVERQKLMLEQANLEIDMIEKIKDIHS
ncbi:PHD-zinc-finger like domain-containing protein [Dipodascopsis uninucleata]